MNSAIPERAPNTLSATPFYTVMTIKTSLQMFLISLCLPDHPTVKKYWVKHFYYLWNKWIHFVSYFLGDAQLEGLCEWTLLWVIKGCLFSFGKDFFGPWFLMNRKEYKRRERKREGGGAEVFGKDWIESAFIYVWPNKAIYQAKYSLGGSWLFHFTISFQSRECKMWITKMKGCWLEWHVIIFKKHVGRAK